MSIPVVVYAPLRAAIKEHEDSAAKIARDIGISYGSILNKLSGKTEFSVTEARLIAERYGCRVDDLFVSDTG